MSTIATFLPLFAGVPSSERARRLTARLHAQSAFWPRFPVPTVPLDAPEFQEEAYWKGPTWLNMNWMTVEALLECDEGDLAEQLRQRTLELVDNAGCSEYFSPLTGRGYGAPEFSWTAALVIELLAQGN
jgi:glycogen debranching enzyme